MHGARRCRNQRRSFSQLFRHMQVCTESSLGDRRLDAPGWEAPRGGSRHRPSSFSTHCRRCCRWRCRLHRRWWSPWPAVWLVDMSPSVDAAPERSAGKAHSRQVAVAACYLGHRCFFAVHVFTRPACCVAWGLVWLWHGRAEEGIGSTQTMLAEKHAAKKKKSSAETWLKCCQKKVKLAKLGHAASVFGALRATTAITAAVILPWP